MLARRYQVPAQCRDVCRRDFADIQKVLTVLFPTLRSIIFVPLFGDFFFSLCILEGESSKERAGRKADLFSTPQADGRFVVVGNHLLSLEAHGENIKTSRTLFAGKLLQGAAEHLPYFYRPWFSTQVHRAVVSFKDL